MSASAYAWMSALRARLGGADQQRVAELGVVVRQVEAADDAAARKLGEHGRHRPIELQHRLVEARPFERELHALDARERGDQLVGARDGDSFATRARPSGPNKLR